MPGVEHLKQFRDELDSLGNELTIRARRGEPADILDLPENSAADADIPGDDALQPFADSDPEPASMLGLGDDTPPPEEQKPYFPETIVKQSKTI